MSQQAFDDFSKKVEGSADLKKAVDEAYQKLGNALSEAHMNYFNAMVDLGKQNGCEFTNADVMKKFDAAREELDDAQLEAVAGGFDIRAATVEPTTTFTSYNPRLPGYTTSPTLDLGRLADGTG
jgi:hypothetical protein